MSQLSTHRDEKSVESGSEVDFHKRNAEWNYAVFVAQGIIVDASKAIGSPRLLLPYLYVATGAPVFLAGALMPLVSVSRFIGQIIAAPIVSAAPTVKWLMVAGWMATAIALAAAGLGARVGAHWIVMLIFIGVALTMGFAKGLNALTFNDLMSRLFSKQRRNSGIFVMSAAGGVVTIGVTWFMHHLSAGRDTVTHDINLAFGAAFITALATLIIMLFRETGARPKGLPSETTTKVAAKASKLTIAESMREFIRVLEFGWFRRYLLMRCLTATVITAMPFYAVHGATHHVHKHAGGLSAFVIATSVAVIVCGPFWRWLGKRSQRYSMALGSALVGVAGIWALTIEYVGSFQTVLAHSFVFAIAAAGIQAVNGSRMLFLIEAAPKKDLAYYVAVTNTVSAILSLIIASIFGFIAQLQGVHWPVVLVVILNFIAAAYSLSLNEPSSSKHVDASREAKSVTSP